MSRVEYSKPREQGSDQRNWILASRLHIYTALERQLEITRRDITNWMGVKGGCAEPDDEFSVAGKCQLDQPKRHVLWNDRYC